VSNYTALSGEFYKPFPILNHYITTHQIEWAIGHKSSGFIYTVPAGFVFDVSIPAYLTWLFDPNDPRFLKAAALHDHMLELGWDRPTAAAIFHEALKADGVSKAKRRAMFLATAFTHIDEDRL